MDIEITNTIKGTLSKPSFIMTVDGGGKYNARITFPVVSDNFEDNKVLEINVDNNEWDDFWNHFDNGRYLVERLKQKYNLSNLIIPIDIENWFINML